MNTGTTIRSNPRRRGMTIIEVLVAMSLFAMFIVGASSLMLMVRKLSDVSRSHYQAVNIAKNRIEQVRNLRRADYNQIPMAVENGVRVDDRGEPSPTGKFRRTTIITEKTPNLIEIGVRVDILNRNTLTFDGEHEFLQSFIANVYERGT